MIESATMTQQEVFKNLNKNDKGTTQQTIGNCVYALEHDPMLAGKIRFNILAGRDSIVGDVGWARTGDPITDRDLSYLKLYLEQHYHLNNEKHLKDNLYRQSSELCSKGLIKRCSFQNSSRSG